MLSSIDFAIIPINAIDKNNLKIVDYTNTSGPYFVSEDDKKGNIKFLVNKEHHRYEENLPHEIHLIPSGLENTENSVEQFAKGEVNHITTIDKLNSEKIFALKEKLGEKAVLHSTMNIRTLGLFFTERGVEELSIAQRIYIGKTMKNVFRDHFLAFQGYEKQDQFFPKFGDGSLKDEEIREIRELFDSSKKVMLPSSLKLSVVRLGDSSSYKEKIARSIEGLHVFDGDNVPSFKKYENKDEMPHMFVAGPDASFSEDIGLITYSVNAGIFAVKKEDRSEWLSDYMQTKVDVERMEKLRSIHIKTLKEAYIVPLVSAPYVALLSEKWESELPVAMANNPFWLIKRKN